ncbi:tetratricopeptide repeat protein [Vitreimonas sp.]|uniref:tetratricopeptide repeat protein n=1 Tax=Vitreimonas sp. TaxID=3069702 RepID=UPI002EDA92C0
MAMRWVWGVGLAFVLAVAACERTPPDPLAEARGLCADESAEAEARMEACGELINTGTLEEAERGVALARRGAATQEAGDVTDALRDYNAALAIDETNALALKGRASIMIASGQLDAAEPLVQSLLASGAYAADAHFFVGEMARLRGDPEAARVAYGEAISADRRYAPAYASRGLIKQNALDYAGAIEDYSAALNINPQLTTAMAGRCWSNVLMQDGNLGRARSDADAAAQADPRNVQAQLCRGLLQLRAGEWEGAQASYEAALEVEPGNPSALFGRGVARRRSGDNEGRDDMNRARDFEPHIARAFEDLGVRTY